ncbi:hypothetical protein LguiB_025543 [Lonicera macranthoides]
MSSVIHMFFYLMLVIIIVCKICLHSTSSSTKYLHSAHGDFNSTTPMTMKPELQPYLNHRKLLVQGGACTNRDISISQSKGLTGGIPQYMVEIVNTCVSGCAPSKIHFHCGWFASARMVNPRTFKRLSYDDCLVNGGRPLKTSHLITFTYSNSFMYPISFKSARFC